MRTLRLALLLALATARPGFSARARWGVIEPAGLDPRLNAQLSQAAARNDAELVTLASAREAARQGVTTLIELAEAESGTESFQDALRRLAGAAPAAR